jgi:pimeloyl-ACP methyl ester carboxylesterase
LDLYKETIPFTAGDGKPCNLVRVRAREREPELGPVLLVHGAGVSSDIFRAPVERDLVQTLAEAGYDVWLENWRASIALPFSHWNLDKAAVHDHPFAVRTVVALSGAKKIKAVIHCQGSTSFIMSAVAGLVPEVSTIVANAVTLHPVLPAFSSFKIRYLLPILERFADRLNPHWGVEAPDLFAKLINAVVLLSHHECDNAVCKGVSFTYGAGRPALWSHENLNPQTHEWLKQEFNAVPLTFFSQMARCVVEGRLVSVDGLPSLPKDFTAQEPKTVARFAFFAGEQNLCFLPQSQVKTFDFFNRFRKDYHSLHLLPNYGHLDVFMGRRAAQDVFPLMLMELAKDQA